MKFTPALAVLITVASALPIPQPTLAAEETPLAKRATGSTINELTNGPCRAVTFIFARGSTELGNIGSSVGPPTCDGLKSQLGANNVACQGVGNGYQATLADNTLPAGTSQAAINAAVGYFNQAVSKCPNTKIVAGGYSQGAAVIHGAARAISSSVRGQVKGLITYGDTRNYEDGGKIPPFPTSQTKIFCNQGDGVCGAGLTVTAQHLAYQDSVGPAVNFLVSKVK